MHNSFLSREDEEIAADQARQNAWMMTFTDLLSVLLSSFILIYAASSDSANVSKWHNIASELGATFNPGQTHKHAQLLLDLDYIQKLLLERIRLHKPLKMINVQNTGDKLILSLPINDLFDATGMHLRLQALPIITFLADILFDIENRITIQGNWGIKHDRFAQNVGSDIALIYNQVVLMAHELKKSGYLYDIKSYVVMDHDHELNLEARQDQQNYQRRIEIIIHDEKKQN